MYRIKVQRKMIVALGVLLLLNLFPMTIYASSILDDVPEADVLATYAEDREYSLLRGNHLNYGDVTITAASSNSVNIYGATICHHTCDDVYLSLYLERKVNGSYGTYLSWNYSDTDTFMLSKSLNVAVPSGYYYRVRGYHAAADSGSARESVSTLTSGIWVGSGSP